MKYIIHLMAIVLAFVLLLSAYGGRVDPVVWTLPSMLMTGARLQQPRQATVLSEKTPSGVVWPDSMPSS